MRTRRRIISPAKFYPGRILNKGALGLLEKVAPTRTKKDG